jgi:hypothetical protein
VPDPQDPTLRPAILVRRGHRWSLALTVAVAPVQRHRVWVARVARRSLMSPWLGRVERWVGRIRLVLVRQRRFSPTPRAARPTPTLRVQSTHVASPEIRITTLQDRLIVRFAKASPLRLRAPLAPAPAVVVRVPVTPAETVMRRWTGPTLPLSAPTSRMARSTATNLIIGYSQVRSVFREVRTIDRTSRGKTDSVRPISRAGTLRDENISPQSETTPNGDFRYARPNDLRQATAPMSAAVGQLDIEVVADRVLQTIQRRAVAWQERLGRA